MYTPLGMASSWKFRKSPHWTEKSLRHAQKPATPRSRQPLWTGKYVSYAWEGPPMAPPLKAEKWRRRGPSRPLLRLAKVTQKRGFCRRFSGSFPAVSRRFCQWSPGGFPRFPGQFSGGFPPVFSAVRRRFSSGFPPFSGGSTAVFRQFSSRFPRLNSGFPASSTAVGQQFFGNTLPLDQPPAGSGLVLHPKETVGQFRTHFQAYAGTQRPWLEVWGTG